MISSRTLAILVCLTVILASLAPYCAAAGRSDDIPIAQAQWIQSEMPGLTPADLASIGTPGVHAVSGQKGPVALRGPMPIFRKSFTLDAAAVSKARVAICGLGQFELTVNGRRVGDHFLDPPWSDYADTCYYVTFDVADLLKSGENVLAVMLGNGMYNVPGGRYTKFVGSFGPPKLILSLVISQGSKKRIIATDKTWKCDQGPITFSCIYGGEDYDARREQPGWDAPGFDDSRWKPVRIVDGPGGRLKPAVSPPVKIIRRLKPVSITRLPDGRYEVDLGENLSCRPFITVKGKAGAKVTIETAERKASPWSGHSYTYTLKGAAQPETFAARFT